MKAIGRWLGGLFPAVAVRTRSRKARTVGGVLLLLLVAGLTGVATHVARAVSTGSSAGAGHTSQGVSGNTGAQAAAQNGSQAGHTGNGASPAATSSASGSGNNGKATPSASINPYPYATPGDAINVQPDMRQSNCWVYPRNINCNVYVHGNEYLMSQTAGQVVVEVLIDNNVVASHTIPAPKGGYRYGWTLTFQIPSGQHDLSFESMVEDTSGKVLAKADPYVIHLH